MSNAGIDPISPLDDLRVQDWEAMIDVNIKGVLYGIDIGDVAIVGAVHQGGGRRSDLRELGRAGAFLLGPQQVIRDTRHHAADRSENDLLEHMQDAGTRTRARRSSLSP